MRRLWKGAPYRCPPSNQQPHEVYINESGLYALVLRSEKQEAKVFKRWVTSEVLPSIRQGCYVQHVIQHKVLCMAKPQQSKEEQRMLRAGKALSFEEVEHLNDMESIVQLSTCSTRKSAAPHGKQNGNCFMHSDGLAKWRACSKRRTKTV